MPSNALERARAIEARQVTREAAALPQRRFPPSSEDEDEAIGGLRAADDGEAVEQSNALLERIRAIEARHAASEAEALRQRRCQPSSEDEDEAIGDLRAADGGEDVEQGTGAEQGSGVADDKRRVPRWSPWSAAGGWTLSGFSWSDCGRRPKFTQIEKVRLILQANPWAWDMDFDPNDAAPTWHWVTPTTLTEADVAMLIGRAISASHMDWLAIKKLGKRRPDEEHPCEPLIWVQHVAYHWNMSLGWCSYSKCPRRDEGMTTYAPKVRMPNGRMDGAPDVFTCERRHNCGYHQAWNISGAVHKSCNEKTNSHNVFGFDRSRAPDGSSEPFPTFQTAGGPSAFFSKFVGGATSHLLDLTPGAHYTTNNLRIQRWCEANGFEHEQGCKPHGKYGCQDGCRYRQKSAEIRLQFGNLSKPRKTKDGTAPAQKRARRNNLFENSEESGEESSEESS